ncbi:peptidoglycan glycosyltransferase FtsW [Pseudogemmobacter blasticus]|uniref:Probable peptidoglycan glycosyltransferase FtsW n=1 Tax=Fuscovulum blasticum DSM 2131 TaxID=1188250 RepID=A0A2T4J625_FUSBL|nr:putative peptidoglycan glycosyltransferase FtsW [Fuscovulum blasticum]AWD20935.1 cell division protein FtsW [Fuscovulum blasticum]PTE13349.1 cell division protein FtsW [Fuscovulum blasticum DSM 2131]
MTEMVYGSSPAAVREPVLPRWWRTIDKWSLTSVFVLFGIGLLLGLAASVPLASRNGLEPYFYVQKQAIFGIMGLSVMVGVSMLSPAIVRRLGIVGFAAALVMVMLLPLVGQDHGKGAVRWLSLGGFSLQPSEFLKPGFVIVTAWLIAAAQDINGPPGRLISFGLMTFVVGFLALQPDFGQSALVVFAWGVIYFVGGASIVLILGIGGLVGLAGFIAYGASEHFARRIDGFLSPDVDPRTQLGYAANAIQEGGFFGVGVGEGQVKWSLPDAHTDFIIAVAAEEYGLILVLMILGLFGVVVVRSLMRLMSENDPFTRLAGSGLACVFGVQAMINMGVAVRLLPAKGMTLPFVSYGGSSLIAAGLTVGMLLALTRSRPRDRMAELFGRRR